jgi:two-component system, NtrC family, response regulator
VPRGDGSTEPLSSERTPLRPLRLTVVAGPDRGSSLSLGRGSYRVGKGAGCDLVLTDRSVSSQHLELRVAADHVVVRDLGSTNGSRLAGARFRELELERGATIAIGASRLRLDEVDAATDLPPSPRTELAAMMARSEAMRRVFTLIERVAPTTATVLIEGETGTGKELVARAMHELSPRAGGPFVVCDLGSLTEALAESELFGHVRGAFTGADRDRTGAFAAADGGTIFLDEIGELPLAVQPRLLRALEQRQVRRIGDTAYRPVDVRVVAATNRDLAAETSAGHFREDLYHRLAIVRMVLPPLRDRPEDVAALALRFAAEVAATAGRPHPVMDDDVLDALAAHDWPGNVRELRNVIERAIALGQALGGSLHDTLGVSRRRRGRAAGDASVPFHQAKERLVDAWEHDYVVELLRACGNNVSLAARRAGVHRGYLHRLIKKHVRT